MSRRVLVGRTSPRRRASGKTVVRRVPNPMTEKQRVSRAIAFARHPDVVAMIRACSKQLGRKRIVSLDLAVQLLFLLGLSGPQRMTIGAAETLVAAMSPESRSQLGIPDRWLTDEHERGLLYERLWSTWDALRTGTADGIRIDHDHHLYADIDTGELEPCPPGCPHFGLARDEVYTAIIQASLPAGFRRTPAIALDSTDLESFFVAYPNGASTPDGRNSYDPDTRWIHRTPADRRPNPYVNGYDNHMATYVSGPGEDEGPRVCAGMVLNAGVTDRPKIGINLTRTVARYGQLTEVLADRAYTQGAAANWARPMRDLGIAVTMDLHTNQRGQSPGPPGTIWLDGHLYTKAIPEPLLKLTPPRIGDTATEKARTHELFDAREPFRFTPHSRHDDVAGSQRFKGPALAGHLRCPNTPASMRFGSRLPTTSCAPGIDCSCGKTVTIADTEHERDRQALPWQSTAWALSYNRRTYIENLNARLRFNNADVNRGFIQAVGKHSTALLLAIYIAAYNTVELHRWSTAHAVLDPWIELTGEVPDTRPLGRATRSARRHRRGPPADAKPARTTPK